MYRLARVTRVPALCRFSTIATPVNAEKLIEAASLDKEAVRSALSLSISDPTDDKIGSNGGILNAQDASLEAQNLLKSVLMEKSLYIQRYRQFYQKAKKMGDSALAEEFKKLEEQQRKDVSRLNELSYQESHLDLLSNDNLSSPTCLIDSALEAEIKNLDGSFYGERADSFENNKGVVDCLSKMYVEDANTVKQLVSEKNRHTPGYKVEFADAEGDSKSLGVDDPYFNFDTEYDYEMEEDEEFWYPTE